jgi:hypothetical protein
MKKEKLETISMTRDAYLKTATGMRLHDLSGPWAALSLVEKCASPSDQKIKHNEEHFKAMTIYFNLHLNFITRNQRPSASRNDGLFS